jgi:hypothetical protein
MAQYFKYFNKVPYIVEESSGLDLLTNLITRIKFLDDVKDVSSSYFFYDNFSGETPESLAYKFYGSVEKHWVILLYNEIIDPLFQWYKTTDVLNKFIDDKYKKNAFLRLQSTYDGTPIDEAYLEQFRGKTLIDNQSPATKVADVINVYTPQNSAYSAPTIEILQLSGSNFSSGETIKTDEGTPVLATTNLAEYGYRYALKARKYFIQFDRTVLYPQVDPKTVSEISEVDELTYREFLTNQEIFSSDVDLFTNDSITLTDNNGVSYTINYEYKAYEKTFNEHEVEENEKLRYIKILKKEYLPKVESEFRKFAGLSL